ncbi:MAG: cation:proton antiporter [Breznakibacter sp.]|nr:cation:proton antiporter [Breznakibacter sp.]
MDLTLLKDIVIIFALSTGVNLLFTKLKLPTILGYLLTGIVAGPHVLEIIESAHNIEMMAEIGVILLLFTIGMEFSLKHLLKIRHVVFLGGLMQMLLTAGTFWLVSGFYGVDWKGGLFMGFLAALSSSALVLKLLQERMELTSNYGRTVLGILIFQDLMLVPLILFTNLLGNPSGDVGMEILILTLKVSGVFVFVYVGNKWLFPKLLHFIALAKNQELFMMSIFLICLGVALLTSSLGLSLAFGAFLAGLMISESEYSHNAFSSLIPLKDTFGSFFFVSIGMLLDVSFVMHNFPLVLLTVLMVILIKTVIASGTGFALGHTFKGTIMVGLALAQVGEFSFILAKIGVSYKLITENYYQLFLSVAIVSMAASPFLIMVSGRLANILLKLPLPVWVVKGIFPLREAYIPEFSNHLVIIGKDEAALKLSSMAKYMKMPHVSIIFDPALARQQQNKGDMVVYGDAQNEPILRKAHIPTADIVVISVGDYLPALSIIEKIRNMNKTVCILVRAKNIRNLDQLYGMGVDQVFPEKLEVAIDLFNRVLARRLLPRREINRIISHIRGDYYGEFLEKDIKNAPLLPDELSLLEITALLIDDGSEADGKTLLEMHLRKRTGASLLAIKRAGEVIDHPSTKLVLKGGDTAYLLGNPEQINQVAELFTVESND